MNIVISWITQGKDTLLTTWEEQRFRLNHLIYLIPITLSILGTFYLLSTTVYLFYIDADFHNLHHSYFFNHQIVILIFALIAMVAITFIPFSIFSKLLPFSIFILILVLIYQLVGGEKIKGTSRWLSLLGLKFQTSEIARLALICYVSWLLTNLKSVVIKLGNKTFLSFLPIFTVFLLVYFQKDTSSAVVLILVTLILFLLGGFPLKPIAWTSLILTTLFTILVLLHPYQRARLVGFFDSILFEDGGFHQIQQSQIAFIRGGLLGVGTINSIQKRGFLPEPHTDSVFAIIGEEFGLVGTSLIIFSYLAFAVICALNLRLITDNYKYLLGWGCLLSILLPALIHIGVNTGFLPPTGIPLPFLSYGGSSLSVNLICVGIIWKIISDESKKFKAF